jgi:hypothetical protein
MQDPSFDYSALRAAIADDLRMGGERELAALVESDKISDAEIETVRRRMHKIDSEQRALFHLDHTQSISVQSLTVMAARDVLKNRPEQIDLGS